MKLAVLGSYSRGIIPYPPGVMQLKATDRKARLVIRRWHGLNSGMDWPGVKTW
jgi:hypothetical protein